MCEKRLSIVIPMYNVEQYIAQCLDSVYQQDILEEEYEVICVNDASPDRSSEVVKEYQKKHNNLILVEHEVNSKLGSARNTGLRIAKGRYVWFVDSDDYIARNCLAGLLRDVEQDDLDIAIFGVQIFEAGKKVAVLNAYMDDGIYDGMTYVLKNTSRWENYMPTAWNKVFRKDFLTKNDLYFADKVMFEDTDWSFDVFRIAKRVKGLKDEYYHYRKNPESITRVKQTPQILAYKIMQQNRAAEASKRAEKDDYKRMIEQYVTSEICALRRNIKELNCAEKICYAKIIRKAKIRTLYKFSNWRTWLAIRYGVTCFV